MKFLVLYEDYKKIAHTLTRKEVEEFNKEEEYTEEEKEEMKLLAMKYNLDFGDDVLNNDVKVRTM